MARRELHRLSAREVVTIQKPGRHADGGGLYLSVSSAGGRRWVFLYRHRASGRLRELGLGGAPGHKKDGVALQIARTRASEARQLLSAGIDPLERKRQNAADKSFGAFAEELIETIEVGFKNLKHRQQWRSSLQQYAGVIWDKALGAVTTDDVLLVLKPIWQTRHETAVRLRGRIERILDAAKARGLRSGDNPARWRGHLKELLPQRKRLTKGHHPALPFEQAPKFIEVIRRYSSTSAAALEFTILTAARTNEVLRATWAEIDIEKRVWTIPAGRMKAGREHRVPLSDRAVDLLRLRVRDNTEYLFESGQPGSPLSNMSMLQFVRGIWPARVTIHGFRSTFKDWAAECTHYENIVTELALAHRIQSGTEAAYRRGDLFERRRRLMHDWSLFLNGASFGS